MEHIPPYGRWNISFPGTIEGDIVSSLEVILLLIQHLFRSGPVSCALFIQNGQILATKLNTLAAFLKHQLYEQRSFTCIIYIYIYIYLLGRLNP